MLWVGQFGIVDGKAQQESPWAGVYTIDSHREPAEAVDLLVMVEPAFPGSEDPCSDLAQTIGQRFRSDGLSLTGGILRAVKAAHEQLRDWNRRSLKQHRVGAGVSCLALRDRAGYLGQVAPAVAVAARGGALQRIEPSLPDAQEPLGLYEEFWPDFSRRELRAGDRLLLLSRDLAAAVDDDELAQALAQPPDETLPVLYHKAKGMQRCAALLVAALSDTP